MTPAQALAAIEQVNFSASWLRPGYDCGLVDDLLDAIVEAVRRETAVSSVVDQVTLVPFRFRSGYRARQVDGFLEQFSAPGDVLG